MEELQKMHYSQEQRMYQVNQVYKTHIQVNPNKWIQEQDKTKNLINRNSENNIDGQSDRETLNGKLNHLTGSKNSGDIERRINTGSKQDTERGCKSGDTRTTNEINSEQKSIEYKIQNESN